MRRPSKQRARTIGDTQVRRKADLSRVTKDIQSSGGNEPRPSADIQDRTAPAPTTPTRIGLLRLDMATFGSAFALTLLAGIYAYLNNLRLGTPELFFLLLAFHAVVLAVRWLWAQVMKTSRRKT